MAKHAARARFIPTIALVALLTTAAGCGSSSAPNPIFTPSTPSPSSTDASSQTSPTSQATSGTAATAAVQVKLYGYDWAVSILQPTRQSFTAELGLTWGTGAGGPGHPLNSPRGTQFDEVTVNLRNVSKRVVPGYQDTGDVSPQKADPFTFVIAQRNAALAGLQIINGSDGPTCALKGGQPLPIATYGTWCDLGAISGNLGTYITQAKPDADTNGPPRFLPDKSQVVTFFEGPLAQSIPLQAIHLLATQQGTNQQGWTLIG